MFIAIFRRRGGRAGVANYVMGFYVMLCLMPFSFSRSYTARDVHKNIIIKLFYSMLHLDVRGWVANIVLHNIASAFVRLFGHRYAPVSFG